MSKQAKTLANTVITVPVSGDTYEAVVIVLEDDTHQILNWADEMSTMGLDVLYSADTDVFVCRIGGDLYIVEAYRNRVRFSKGHRYIDTNVITRYYKDDVPTDVPTIAYIPTK